MKKPLPPVPAGTEPELRAFLEALRASIQRLEEAAPDARKGGAEPGARRAARALRQGGGGGPCAA